MAIRALPARKHIVDTLVGARLRARRLEIGLTQQKLAGLLGISFTQVQKYEQGMNRIGASRLVDIANALDVSPSFFFDAIPSAVDSEQSQLERDLISEVRSLPTDELRRAALEMVRVFVHAVQPPQRRM